MAKGDDEGPPWLKALGMVTLTRAMDSDEHTLWLFDHPEMVGDRRTVRNAYADYLAGHWLEKYYRVP